MNLVMVGYKAKDLLDKTICKSVSSFHALSKI